MASSKGRTEVGRYIASIPGALETKVLRGAARAAARVVADEAKLRSNSDEISAAIKVSTRQTDPTRVIAKVIVKGKGAYKAPWLEYGTDPHFISVDPEQSGGKSARRLNQQVKEGSLVINGKPVGATVFHPGAKPHPFMRPALDIKRAEAIAAAQGYVTTRIAREDIGGAEVPEDVE